MQYFDWRKSKMQKLYDETYTSEDGLRKSRNIWYGSADMIAKGEHAMVIKLEDDLRDMLCKTVKKDLSLNSDVQPTETNWYFYGSGITADDIGGNILPAIMIRERENEFITNFNISDHDFALNIDKILFFKIDLENHLRK